MPVAEASGDEVAQLGHGGEGGSPSSGGGAWSSDGVGGGLAPVAFSGDCPAALAEGSSGRLDLATVPDDEEHGVAGGASSRITFGSEGAASAYWQRVGSRSRLLSSSPFASASAQLRGPSPQVVEREALLHAARHVTRQARMQASVFSSMRSDYSTGEGPRDEQCVSSSLPPHLLMQRARASASRRPWPHREPQESTTPRDGRHDGLAAEHASSKASATSRHVIARSGSLESMSQSCTEEAPAAEAIALIPHTFVPRSANAQRTLAEAPGPIPDSCEGTQAGDPPADGDPLATVVSYRRWTSDEFSDSHSIPGEDCIAPPNISPKYVPPRLPSTLGTDAGARLPTDVLIPDPGVVEEVAEAAEPASGFLGQWRQGARRLWDGVGSSVAAAWTAADETAMWAERRLEEEFIRALQSACLSREIVKAGILDYSASLRSKLIGGFKEMIKSVCLSDPDMWPSVKRCYSDALDRVLDDIEHEIEVSLEAALLKQHSLDEMPGPSGGALFTGYCRVRAFVLYHYLPHDLSIFGKIKDPVYLLMVGLTLLPVHLLRVAFFSLLLVFLLFPGPPDEFQMINFILMLKGSQFVSSGLFMMARGSMSYFACFACCKSDMGACVASSGPGSLDALSLGVIDYLGSIVLPWVAFHWLPRSQKHVTRTYVGRQKILDDVDEDEEKAMTGSSSIAAAVARMVSFNAGSVGESSAASPSASPCSVSPTLQGGSLSALLWYDVKSFVFSLVVLAALGVYTWRADDYTDRFPTVWSWCSNSPQFGEDLFWVKVLYGLLTLPFLPFMVPLFLKVLTHCEWTGFNEHGACIEYALPAESRTSWRRRRTRSAKHVLASCLRLPAACLPSRLTGCFGRHGHTQ